jgi:hypothetical protein
MVKGFISTVILYTFDNLYRSPKLSHKYKIRLSQAAHESAVNLDQ